MYLLFVNIANLNVTASFSYPRSRLVVIIWWKINETL